MLRAQAKDLRRALVLAVVCGMVLLAPIAIFVAAQPARASHLLGASTEVRAEILDVTDRGRCGSRQRRTEWRVQVRYTLDGVERTGAYTRCGGSPRTSTTVTVWVGPTGWIEDSSPTYDRIGSLLAGAAPAAVLLALVGGTMLRERRRRDALLRLERDGLGPIGWVALWPAPGGRGQVKVAWPGHGGIRDAVLDVVVATGADGAAATITEVSLPAPREVEIFPGRGRGNLVYLESDRGGVWAWLSPGRRSRRDLGAFVRR